MKPKLLSLFISLAAPWKLRRGKDLITIKTQLNDPKIAKLCKQRSALKARIETFVLIMGIYYMEYFS
jgi:hypothetical protein